MARERGTAEWADAEREIRARVRVRESFGLNEYATPYEAAERPFDEPKMVADVVRGEFSVDGFRNEFNTDIGYALYCHDFSRLGDKAQVHSMPWRPTIMNRGVHSHRLAYIADEAAMNLGLNVHLAVAGALFHDIGHFAMGHPGEDALSRIGRELGFGNVHHAVQGLRVVDYVANRDKCAKGSGLNLTNQVRNSILFHDGEADEQSSTPNREIGEELMQEYIRIRKTRRTRSDSQKYDTEGNNYWRPATMEGLLIKFLDTVSYIGGDIEDAIKQGLLRRDELPIDCVRGLGSVGSEILGTLLKDLMVSSYGNESVGYSDEVYALLVKLKNFCRERIYYPKDLVMRGETAGDKRFDGHPELLRVQGFDEMMRLLFDTLYDDLEAGRSNPYMEAFLQGMDMKRYKANTPNSFMQVCDCIGSMTDPRFFEVVGEIRARRMSA